MKVKNARHGLENPNARYRKEVSVEDVLTSAVVSDPLHLLDICATSDGAAAVVLLLDRVRREARPRRRRADQRDLDGHADLPANRHRHAATLDRRDDRGRRAGARRSRSRSAHAAYEEAGIDPADVSLAEVYDLSTALELDWIEDLQLCKRGEAEALLRAGDTTIGGRIPVNPSGGLACFGEAVPAQALAQVCEVTWQLRGQATGRQVEGARVGITANQGLFGHGSSVILSV